MVDVVDKATRSKNMASIRGKNTGPELLLRTALHKSGLRYRLHVRNMQGSPDIVLPKYRAVIFVHGCFWHRHKRCRFAALPASNSSFWNKKFRETVKRDRKNIRRLTQDGWRVAVVWECAIGGDLTQQVVRLLRRWLKSKQVGIEFPIGGPGPAEFQRRNRTRHRGSLTEPRT